MKLLTNIKNDFKEILPPAIFFFIAFTLILITKRLILSEYGISWTGFGPAFVGAFLIGKVVLLADKLPFVNRFPNRQLIYKDRYGVCYEPLYQSSHRIQQNCSAVS